MLTPEFEWAAGELIKLAEESRVCYMCAERVYFRCHRMLVSDWLLGHGHEVLHIDDMGPVKPHKPMAEGRMIDSNTWLCGCWTRLVLLPLAACPHPAREGERALARATARGTLA